MSSKPPIFKNPTAFGTANKSITGASLIAQAIRDLGNITLFTAEEIGSIIYPRTAAEIAAGVTPTNYSYPPGNVLRYGGDTNFATALRQAIEGGGGTVYLDGPSFDLSEAVDATITGDLIIYGNGNTIINSTVADDGSTPAAIKITGTTDSKIKFSDFSLVHTYTSGSALGGIVAYAPSSGPLYQATMDHITVRGFPYYGIDVGAVQQTHIGCRYTYNIHAGCTCSGGSATFLGCEASYNGNGSDNTEGYGLVCTADVHIHGGIYQSNDRYNIDCRYADRAMVVGATIRNAGLYGFYAVNEDGSKDSRDITLLGCDIDQLNRASSSHAVWIGGYGASMTSTPGMVKVAHNRIRNSLGRGILIGTGTSSKPPDSVSVCHNDLEEIDSEAIYVGDEEVPQVDISHNQIKNAGGNGDVFVNAATYATLCSNKLIGGSRVRGIYLGSGTKAVSTGNIAVGTFSDTAYNQTATTLSTNNNI